MEWPCRMAIGSSSASDWPVASRSALPPGALSPGADGSSAAGRLRHRRRRRRRRRSRSHSHSRGHTCSASPPRGIPGRAELDEDGRTGACSTSRRALSGVLVRTAARKTPLCMTAQRVVATRRWRGICVCRRCCLSAAQVPYHYAKSWLSGPGIRPGKRLPRSTRAYHPRAQPHSHGCL